MKKVLHKRSNDTQSGGPKIPSASTLEYGEIAINYHDGVEKLFIKNDNNKIKTIRTDDQLPPVEKHENQEFVYRQAVNTNEAKSLELTRIYGKTLAWNSLVQNGNFASDSGWIVTGGATMSIASNIATIDLSSPSSGVIGVYQGISMTKDHIYYFAFDVKFSTADFTADPSFYIASTGLYGLPGSFSLSPDKSTSWKTYSAISRPIGANGEFANGFGLRLYNALNNTVPSNFQLSNTLLIDLTLMFGAGNEPSTVEEFESMFPEPYYPYNEGTLISNDCKEIETIGFNLWDEEWELGGYVYANGEKYTANDRIRNKKPIKVSGNTEYYAKMAYAVFYYDSSMSFIGYDIVAGRSFTAPQGCSFVNIVVDPATTYNHDVCVNIYNREKNGTYEPHTKSTIRLNLNDFYVKDPNGGADIRVTGGLKSAGDVCDEIIGNKYIKRVDNVKSFNTHNTSSAGYKSYAYVMPGNDGLTSHIINTYGITRFESFNSSSVNYEVIQYDSSGINYIAISPQHNVSDLEIYYALATPIEYELVDPIYPVVKAGTTECRISPDTEYGLSAPMVCDMQYTMDNDYLAGEFNSSIGDINSRIGDIESVLATI